MYRGRRYPPRAVAELAYRLATGNPAAHRPRPAGAPTNTLLERLDFTVSTKRPVLTSGSAHEGDETARQQAEDLYTGLAPAAPSTAGHAALRPRYDRQRLIAPHLYQLYAYLQNQQPTPGQALEGILLYPAAAQAVDVRYTLGGHPVRVVTLNLHQPWSGIAADLLGLIE